MILRSAWTVRATLLLASGSIGTLAAASAGAHDVWLTADKSGDQLSAQINNGDADKRDIPDRNRVVTLDLIDSGGTLDLRRPLKPGQRLGQPVLETKPFPISAGSVLAISYDNGFWINAAANKTEINTTKLMVADGTSAHWTVKYGKLLLGPGSFERVLHTRLELVALQDPYRLAPGQKLPVRLELSGKPVAGAQIAYGDGIEPIPDAKMPYIKTGNDGVAEIPVTRRGPYLLTVDCDAPPLHPALADRDHIYASLTFDTSR